MMTYEKVLLLKNVPLFDKASELALSDLISVGKEKILKEGEVLLEPTQENTHLFLILSGQLKVEKSGAETVELEPRQMVGETTVFNPSPLGVKVVAQKKTTLLKWDSDQLYTIMSLHPSLARAFLGTLSYRLKMLEKNEKET